jgi:hypothetical protein
MVAALLIPVILGGLALVLFGLLAVNNVIEIPSQWALAEICRTGSIVVGVILVVSALAMLFGPFDHSWIGGVVGAVYVGMQGISWRVLVRQRAEKNHPDVALYIRASAMCAGVCVILILTASLFTP